MNSVTGVTGKEVFSCAFCDGSDLELVIDFGHVALAGGFLTSEQFPAEKKYPLRVCFCRDCFAVQVVDIVEAKVLFTDYFYFSSSIGTLRDHFSEYAKEVTARFLDPPSATVLEFGCNDGVLLKPLADLGVARVIGVDPASNVLATIDDPRLSLFNGFFDEPKAAEIVAAHGKVDLVMANNVYAHIPDIQGVTRAVAAVLKEDGVFVFEVHYLGKVLEELQYDMIYHEHLYYYSLLSAQKHFARYGMVIFDIKHVPIHAGSLRFYVCNAGSRHASSISEAVRQLEAEERSKGYDRSETFSAFSRRVAGTRSALLGLLGRLRADGCAVAGYGASGRANTMIQYCGLSREHLVYMIDDAPAKQGYFTPGSHIPIHSSEMLRKSGAPSYILVFAWSFLAEIARRNADFLERGGKMIVPLPEVRIHSSDGVSSAA